MHYSKTMISNPSPLSFMASPSNQQQQTWVPYETNKDCTQGFCSIYCPQWCYIIFPPPPPFSFVDDDDSSSNGTFSPLVIAIIGILASAFLLVSYYTIVSKCCGGSFRRHRAPRNPNTEGDIEVDIGGQSHHNDTWISPSNGLDETLINKIAVCRYKAGDGLVESTDCSVCLSEFREGESLRLLPKCSHAFHLLCIDTWLKSHSNCPLCRASIVSVNPAPVLILPVPPPPQETNHQARESGRNDEMVVVIEDLEEINFENESEASKESSDGQEENHQIIEVGDNGSAQPIRRSFSMDSLHRGRVSIADVLEKNIEDEYLAAKELDVLVGGGSSSRKSRGLHCVMSPTPMKRSVSSGRFCFTKQGRGKTAIL